MRYLIVVKRFTPVLVVKGFLMQIRERVEIYLTTLLILLNFCSLPADEHIFPSGKTIEERIAVPAGYERVKVEKGSYEEYLRTFPVKKHGTKVYLYNGKLKGVQDLHSAVLAIDTGDRDLQQCADAVMRLRAEYFYREKNYSSISFNFTNGFPAPYQKYAEGYRIKDNKNGTSWIKKSDPDYSYSTFRNYLYTVFNYAGSASLSKELIKVKDLSKIKIGDIFIQGGFPGHAVLVVDAAVHKKNGKKIFLIAQSYMPAQDIHILKNPEDEGLSPWYSTDFGEELYTPEWTFKKTDLKRFKE